MDSKVLSNIFKRIKEKGILKEAIKIKLDPLREMKQKEPKDLVDQIALARYQKGFSRRKMAEFLGIPELKYTAYETRDTKINDTKTIKKLINMLNIKKPKLTEYQKFLLDEPIDKIKKYVLGNNISTKKMAKILNVDKQNIDKWIKGDETKITESNFKKMKESYNMLLNENFIEENEIE